MIQLSGVIIAFNEERDIAKCLQSLQNVVDEIIVVDSLSTDRTVEICIKYGAKVIKQPFLGYKEQKEFALTQATYNHVVSLDADESLSEELQASIIALKNNWIYDGYYIARRNFFCNQWINHSSWYPNRKLRVFDKRKGQWKGINPHDTYILKNEATKGKLKGDILHWTFRTKEEYVAKMEKFSTIAAQSYYTIGKKATFSKRFINPAWSFIKTYFIRCGFLDGKNGFLIAKESARYTYKKYAKLKALDLQ